MESTLGIHHHRHSIRLKGYDYSQPGAYFVTLVTHQREDSFGSICMDRVELTALGRIVQEEWRRSAEIRKEIRLWDDEFVVMPNHVHGIVWIVGGGVGADGIRPGSPGKIPGVEDTGRGDGENRGDGEIGGACITRGAYHAPLRDDEPVGVGVDGIRPGLTGITHDMEDTGGGNGETRDECITRGAWHVPLRGGEPVGGGADGIRPGSPG